MSSPTCAAWEPRPRRASKNRSVFRPARQSILIFCAGLLLPNLSAFLAGANSTNSCVTCHQTILSVNYLEHDFADWERSVHSKAGVTCDACHGGNPAETDVAKAHAGMKSSRDADSPVYFTRIPATCGTCHPAEFKAFKKSAHYHELEHSGRGPNCVTCHGSMANHILAPRDLDQSCSLCHQQPTQAFATMLALNNAGGSVVRLQKALEDSRAKHLDVSAQEQSYQAVKTLDLRAREDWHTFKLAQVLKASQEITQQVNVALNELRLKEQQKK
jgi:hypothetical protein